MNELLILIPVLNNQTGMEESLRSIAGAEGLFDVLIVDDGSAPALAQPHNVKFPGSFEIIRVESTTGAAMARNVGVRRAIEGGYAALACLDAGDTVAPSRFRRQMEILAGHPEVGVVSSFIRYYERQTDNAYIYRAPEGGRMLRSVLSRKNPFNTSSMLLRVAALKAAGGLDPAVIGCEDYELVMRLYEYGYEGWIVPEVLTMCPLNVGGITVNQRRPQMLNFLWIQMRYFTPTPGAILGLLRTAILLIVPVMWIYRLRFTYASLFFKESGMRDCMHG